MEGEFIKAMLEIRAREKGLQTIMGPDEGVLALVTDGCVQNIAFHLNLSPQRVHQIIGNDPFNAYMRIHRALAASCPARAQSMADRFNSTHNILMSLRRPQRMTTAEALGAATTEGVDVIKAELERLPVGARKQETIEHIRALWAYYDALEDEEAGAQPQDLPHTHSISTGAGIQPRAIGSRG